ncbi:MAG: molybdopterin-dependent oxidoreductase, partial [Thermodesulfobacteriota bacterium]|nr:molybdopterin-dependent oxidoreductase [Thermodesulfobacteriota bacterium]
MTIKATGPSKERVVKTLCPMCATHCGVKVNVRENTIVSIKPNEEHFLKRLCIKSQAAPEMQSSMDRLLHPLKKINGDWKPISWDKAMDFIISKLRYIEQNYGTESLAIEFGHGLFNKESIGLVRKFAEAFGTPNIADCGCICQFLKACAYYITWNEDIYADVARAKCIVNWGADPWNSATPARPLYRQLKDKGQKLIVIDPRKIRISEMADFHLRIRPGVDWALLLAWLNIIISEDRYDKHFVEKYTIGFDKLVEAVKDYTPKWAEDVTGIPEEDIIESA